MVLITDLPIELLRSILDNLLPTGPATTHTIWYYEIIINSDFLRSRGGLAGLARTCRGLRNITQPYLYRIVLIKNHRELLLFFRTLATTPRIRRLVRSFFWTCKLALHPAAKEDENGFHKVLLTLEQDARECWRAVAPLWPQTEDEAILYRLYLLTGPDRLMSWGLLGAVLGMLTHVRQLYMVISRCLDESQPYDDAEQAMTIYPEHQCLERLLDPRGHGWALEHWPVIDNLHKPAPRPGTFTNWAVVKSSRFLQHLESITLDPGDFHHIGLAEMTMASLRFLLGTSPKVRRVELRGIPDWGVLRSYFRKGRSYEPFVCDNVKHFTHLNAMQTTLHLEALAHSFPKLESLHVTNAGLSECQGPYGGFDKLRRSISRLAPTLRRLEWMSSSRADPISTGFDHAATPVLASIVGKFYRLQHFTTEAIWLFSRDNLDVAFNLSAMLPPSLESFHLVDAWGRVESLTAPLHQSYYPDFPGGNTPLQFFGNVLRSLRDGCAGRNTRLVDVKLTSPLFAGDLGQTPETREFIETHTRAFADLGRVIKLVAPSSATAIFYDEWANVL